MQRGATPADKRKRNHGGSFLSVLDSRKRKIPGLWQRDNKFYAQIRVDLGEGRSAPRRFALSATHLDAARTELERKRIERTDGKLPQPGHRPRFCDFVHEYLDGPTLAQKKEGTRQNERQALSRWVAHLGGIRIDKLSPTAIYDFREKRLGGGASPRTTNLDVVALRNVLKLAVERGLIEKLPEVRQLKQKPSPEPALLSREEVGRLLAACTPASTKNWEVLRHYLRFLALTGAREQEALKVLWNDVDFARQVVKIGRGGVAKNHKQRDVNFSPELDALLVEMRAARALDSRWLFPSPQRGLRDVPAKCLRDSLNRVRASAGLPETGFHDLRHFFASHCVMAGVDFMTISKWLGHSDGGILVGKTYGHLTDTHKRAAALTVTFLP